MCTPHKTVPPNSCSRYKKHTLLFCFCFLLTLKVLTLFTALLGSDKGRICCGNDTLRIPKIYIDNVVNTKTYRHNISLRLSTTHRPSLKKNTRGMHCIIIVYYLLDLNLIIFSASWTSCPSSCPSSSYHWSHHWNHCHISTR